ncbi:hypothetical protein Pse7367_3176 [Thalassoporum mexicanum PCC 7367]|uniref:hypothetical protein n=1 Tax=Thalassoporum mexicanum TaxID=3457544 RepID=UPI00029F8703|nr:hypothetical protein [Pseudanabaena sp. PCC 7367]AFY71424.1 hypothetical protein Pse7367_3176 [Pseudanabaena sp. PCC 7367]
MKSHLHSIKYSIKYSIKLTVLTLAAVGLSLSLGGNIAQAGETTIRGRNGRTGTINTNVNRQNNRLNYDRQITYPNGRNANSTGEFIGDRNGNYKGNVTRTNVNGKSNNYFVEGTRTRTNGTRTNDAVITGPNQNQATFNSSSTCNSGSCTGNRSLTYPNGKTRTTTLTGERVAPGEYSGDVNVTGRNGRTRSGEFYHRR